MGKKKIKCSVRCCVLTCGRNDPTKPHSFEALKMISGSGPDP